ncbi:hypothetical protein B566_EDAN012518 [Ephemera danica]|nr:hypothetical protein B566_EDAN012518 [Ephemera danica]
MSVRFSGARCDVAPGEISSSSSRTTKNLLRYLFSKFMRLRTIEFEDLRWVEQLDDGREKERDWEKADSYKRRRLKMSLYHYHTDTSSICELSPMYLVALQYIHVWWWSTIICYVVYTRRLLGDHLNFFMLLEIWAGERWRGSERLAAEGIGMRGARDQRGNHMAWPSREGQWCVRNFSLLCTQTFVAAVQPAANFAGSVRATLMSDEDSNSCSVGRTWRSQSLPHVLLRPERPVQTQQQHAQLGRPPLLTLAQHYYPEGGWGWLVAACALLVQSLAHGLHQAAGKVLDGISSRLYSDAAVLTSATVSWRFLSCTKVMLAIDGSSSLKTQPAHPIDIDRVHVLAGQINWKYTLNMDYTYSLDSAQYYSSSLLDPRLLTKKDSGTVAEKRVPAPQCGVSLAATHTLEPARVSAM